MQYIGKKSLSGVLRTVASIALVLEIVLAGVIVVALLVTMCFQSSRTYTWPVTFEARQYAGISPAHAGVAEAQLSYSEGVLKFSGRNDWGQMLLTITGVILGFGTVIYITIQLKRILGAFRRAEPFSAPSARAMVCIGAALVAYPLLKLGFDILFARYLNSRFEGLHFGLQFHPLPIFCGLLVLVVAYIFRLGLQLQEEKNLTI